LEITHGRAKHKNRHVRSSAFLIGSAPDCDLVLGDPRFDPVHSYVFVSPTRVTIRQLGFGPPLCVDGRQVAWAALADLDRLQMGTYEFQIRIEWPQGNPDIGQRGGATQETLAHEFDRDRATERLLRDVEQHTDVPRLSLFVGDDQHETDEQVLPLSTVDPRAWRQTPKKASS
jgi:hypothetical protein